MAFYKNEILLYVYCSEQWIPEYRERSLVLPSGFCRRDLGGSRNDPRDFPRSEGSGFSIHLCLL